MTSEPPPTATLDGSGLEPEHVAPGNEDGRAHGGAGEFVFQPPPLPDPAVARRLIERCIVHQVVGCVAAVSGETVEVEGLTAPIGSVCEWSNGSAPPRRLRVIGFRGSRPLLSPLERLQGVAAGDRVRLIDSSMQILVGPSLCGRIVDAFGRPIDGQPMPLDLEAIDADQQPPESLERPPIDQPLQTGVRAIDAMLTCGLGQRLGIFAGSGVGKSTLMGMLARGSNADRIVIGMVGERGREVQEFITRCLGEAGLARSVVVVATSDRPAAQRVAAAWTATAVAETFRDRGENVLLLLDSVTRFAMAQRELGLAAGEPPTTRGYPPSVFQMLPRLVERAGRTKRGSITAFYTVLVEGDDNNEPIADTLRGILDGHIVLSRQLASKSHWPPIDILQSLSRLQPHLVSREAGAAADKARAHLDRYRQHADLISIGAYRPGTDPMVDAAIAIREPLNHYLTQGADELAALPLSQQQLVQLINAPASSPPAVQPAPAGETSPTGETSPAGGSA